MTESEVYSFPTPEGQVDEAGWTVRHMSAHTLERLGGMASVGIWLPRSTASALDKLRPPEGQLVVVGGYSRWTPEHAALFFNIECHVSTGDPRIDGCDPKYISGNSLPGPDSPPGMWPVGGKLAYVILGNEQSDGQAVIGGLEPAEAVRTEALYDVNVLIGQLRRAGRMPPE